MTTGATQSYLKNQLFLAGTALVVIGMMAIFFLALSWAVGGDAFMDTLNGKMMLAMLGAGVGLGAGLMLTFRERAAGTAHLTGNGKSAAA
ncbi:MAG: hypothetical protein AB1642_01325 [Pseudomonadota bacterium]